MRIRTKRARFPKRNVRFQKEPSFLSLKLTSWKTWALLAVMVGVGAMLQFLSIVSFAIEDDLFPSCSTNDHCQVGRYCVFGQCYAHTPDYPEIGKVRLFYADGGEALPDVQGLYNVPSGKLMYLDVKADNQHRPFILEVYSGSGFGMKGIEENRRIYFSPIDGSEKEYKYLYWVPVNQNTDFRHRFYFELVNFEGEKFNMFVYLKSSEEIPEKTSEIIELPIKVV